MGSLPAELLSSVITFVWQDAQQTAHYGNINACSLCCQQFYRESRLRMFHSVEFQQDGSPSATHTAKFPLSRVLARLTRLCTLLRDNPTLGNNITSLTLQLLWDGNTEAAISQQRDADIVSLLGKASMLQHLAFGASSRRAWAAIGRGVRDALQATCSSKHISSLQFSRIMHLPVHMITTSLVLSVQLRDVSLHNSGELAGPSSPYGSRGFAGQQSQMASLSVEYSSINDVLATWPSTFRHLRQLHTRLAVNTETQQLIDATRTSLEDFSCHGKAMVRQTSAKLSSEDAAGVGPFAFHECYHLRSLAFHYCTPRGNINGFTSALLRTLETLERGICLDALDITFQTSTSADLVPLLASPLWTHMEQLFSHRSLFRKVRIRFMSDANALPRQSSNGLKSASDLGPLATALDAPARLPCLFREKAIHFYLNSAAIPYNMFHPQSI